MTDDAPSRATRQARTAEQKEAARSALRRVAPERVARAMAMEGQAVPVGARTVRMRRVTLDAALAGLEEGAGAMGENVDDEPGRLEPLGQLYSRRAFTYTGAAEVRPWDAVSGSSMS